MPRSSRRACLRESPHRPRPRSQGGQVMPTRAPLSSSEQRKLQAKITTLRATVEELTRVLEELVRANEEWNAAVLTVVGKQPAWSDSYLDAARAAIARAKETP